MHHSFHALDGPGDTQPDSQLYRRHTSVIQDTPVVSSRTVKSLFTEHVDEDDDDSPTDGVEFVASSQGQQSPTVTSPTVMHDDDILGALPPGHYAPTSPLKFETPALAGRKRDSSGHMLSSAVRTDITTPGTVASAAAFAFPGFGVGGIAPMSLTQAWQNTQAHLQPYLKRARIWCSHGHHPTSTMRETPAQRLRYRARPKLWETTNHAATRQYDHRVNHAQSTSR
jgi:hypothetical protein